MVDCHIYSDSTDKSSLDDRHASLPTELHLPDYIPDSFTVTPYAVESILSSLHLGKAAGPDVINNIQYNSERVEGRFICSSLRSFNASLSQGQVPAYGRKQLSQQSIR